MRRALASLALIAAGCSPDEGSPEALRGIRLTEVASGFAGITDLQFVPGRTDLLAVLQQEGAASWLSLPDGRRGQLLDLPVATGGEMGLLGLAFHPDFAENRRIYVNYVVEGDEGRQTRISEFTVAGGEPLGPAGEERILLRIPQPQRVHKGGQLQFGPDGFLYIGLGDGGGDAFDAQDPQLLLGKILRIDVDRRDEGLEYAVPEDNPFTPAEARPEIWALGLRNPWRFSFDPQGRLIAGDVGKDFWEEIDLVVAGGNYGWPIREGAHCHIEQDCSTEGLIDPIHEYGREVGGVVTGGYVYRGERIPGLQGMYVFTDFVSGRIFALALGDDDRVTEVRELGSSGRNVATLGRDAAGELYFGAFDGAILRLDSAE